MTQVKGLNCFHGNDRTWDGCHLKTDIITWYDVPQDSSDWIHTSCSSFNNPRSATNGQTVSKGEGSIRLEPWRATLETYTMKRHNPINPTPPRPAFLFSSSTRRDDTQIWLHNNPPHAPSTENSTQGIVSTYYSDAHGSDRFKCADICRKQQHREN